MSIEYVQQEKERRSLGSFLDALTVVVVVLVLFALPYAVTEVYGLKARSSMPLVDLVALAVLSVALSRWLVRYRQTNHDFEVGRWDSQSQV